MKPTLIFFLLTVILLHNPGFSQTSGGPDLFGYKWANNQNPMGPSYSWKEIKGASILVNGLGDDNSSGPFDVGFYFNYYGKWYNSIWIGSNGWVSFQRLGNIEAPFPSIPTSSKPNNFIAGMLADLTFKDSKNQAVPGAAAYFRTNHKDSAIIQFDSIPFWTANSSGYSGRNTFEIILSGATNSITFQYKQVVNSTPSYSLSITGLKTGIEDSTGNCGLPILSDTFPTAASAVKIFYPGTFSTNDMGNMTLSTGQNYPNPCSNFTSIPYTISKNENVTISIQNMIGEEIESFSSGKMPAGNHSFLLNTQNYPSGIYFYSLSARGVISTRKMLIAK